MLHKYRNISEGDPSHYAVSTNGRGEVLVQVGDKYGEQARIGLTLKEAQELVNLILEKIEIAKTEV